MFVMFCCVLLTNGLVRSEIGVDAQGAGADGANDRVPAALLAGGPIIDPTLGQLHTYAMPPKVVALTFDDGPDPEWTPQILDVLAKHHVPATFFVVGSSVALYPDITRRIRELGCELGVHTFTHPDLREVSRQRVDREIAKTQLAIAGATGELTYLVRPPYSSDQTAVDDKGWDVMYRLGQQGYVSVLSDVDSNDWQRPGVDRIVEDAVPEDGYGGVVLLHDAGGDRSQTVEALDRLIPRLRADGFVFSTVSAGIGLPAGNFRAGGPDLLMGHVMLGAVVAATAFIAALEVSLLIVGVLVMVRLLVVVTVAVRHTRRRTPAYGWGPPRTGPVTVVVPAYNERECIVATVRSLAASTHPVEIVVVDDGSDDGTGELVTAMALPDVRLIRQDNAGKAAALNTGIAAASHDIVVMVDGDTVFEPETVGRLIEPFADPQVGAVAGNARVGDRTRLISRWQHIEYVIGFNIDRRAQDAWRAVVTVPGAVGAFRASTLAEVGGVSADTLAEDTDLTVAIGRAGWRVVYQPTARAWTEAPSTFGQLWRQRYRWSYGVMQSLWKHRAAVLERGRTGRLGRAGLLTTALFQILLPLLAPMIDLYLVYGLLFLKPVTTAVVWAVITGVQVLAGVVAFRLEGEPLRQLWLLPMQQLVYRQVMYAVLIQSVATALIGSRTSWLKNPRTGELTAVPTDPAAAGPVAVGGASVPSSVST